MLTKNEAFESAIAADPHDNATRLVYADWLEEQGDARHFEQREWVKANRDIARVVSGEKVEPYAVHLNTLRSIVQGYFEPVTRIDSLTAQQQSLLKWFELAGLKTGLATGPTNRNKCETAVRLAYRLAGLVEPEEIIWAASPKAGVKIIANSSVRASVRDSVRDSVRASVWDSVRTSVQDSVQDSVWASVRASVRNSVWDSVWASVWASVRNSVRNSVCYGSHDSHWLSFYSTLSAFGLYKKCGPLDGLFRTLECGWWWPCSDIAVLTELPIEVVMNGRKISRIVYGDGFKLNQ